ncbi:ribosome small subunit-dependent GTPase A [Ligilactobacillus sp.]|uniref:ribosome small subunit-dependent GTPase A n=1 Tax=Ligilactobacillus sp. TaxID=2767921 RepID=UPI002FE328AF
MNESRARVISQEKGIYRLQSGTEIKPAVVSGKYRYETRTVSDYPAVGDYVIAEWPEDDSRAVIEGLFPRRSCLIRKAAGTAKREQVVAANIDTVFICMSLNSNFNIRRLERYLSVTYDSGATPVVVLTKSDLCSDLERRITEVRESAPGVDVLAISSLNDDYEAVMKYMLPCKTVAFIGSSGVGKSTLINRLTGTDSLPAREIGNDDKGRHTTTHRELITLDNGAFVIDTPGMRELGMWDNDAGIDTEFADIEELSRTCKYSDCTHTSEPGCSVLKAVMDGTLDVLRLESYRKLKNENAYAADNSRYLEAKRAKFKRISRINRSGRKHRY